MQRMGAAGTGTGNGSVGLAAAARSNCMTIPRETSLRRPGNGHWAPALPLAHFSLCAIAGEAGIFSDHLLLDPRMNFPHQILARARALAVQ
jgi:hypothetical protein